MSNELLNKHILAITAHPDDESFAAAGTIYNNSLAGGKTELICATLGEKGSSHLTTPVSEHELKIIRRKELEQAASIIGIKSLHVLDLPDGQVKNYQTEFFEQALQIAKRFEPELIMSFGPDGLTGHSDHIAAFHVAQNVAQELKLPLATFCLPKSIHAEIYSHLKQRRRNHSHYETEFSLSNENCSINVNSQVKLQALRCYQSQIDNNDPFANFSERVSQTLLTQECFQVSDPLR